MEREETNDDVSAEQRIDACEDITKEASLEAQAALVRGQDTAALRSIEKVVEGFRQQGVVGLFLSDLELRDFYKNKLENIVAQLSHLLDSVLNLLVERLEKDPKSFSTKTLKDLADSTGRLLTGLTQTELKQAKKQDTPEELREQIAQRKRELEDLRRES